MQETKKTLILTLALDPVSQAFFNDQRELYFPPERNKLKAHLTLFHQLPDAPETYGYLAALQVSAFNILIPGLMNLGAGVAYRVESRELTDLQKQLRLHFQGFLIPQDLQGFRPHITIMNKSTPAMARALLSRLTTGFESFMVHAIGLNLWIYENGPWKHERSIPFKEVHTH